MKRFLRDLTGGLVIIAAAVAVGVLHNTVRGHPIPLVQNVPAVTTAHSGGGDTTTAGDTAGTPAGQPAVDSEGSITVERAKALLDEGGAFFIDARARNVFDEGHIPGAIVVPYDQLQDHYQELMLTIPTDAAVVCYCWGPDCDFSDQLALELKIMGYTNVFVFTGGWEHWEAAGYPVEVTEKGQ